MFHWVQIWHHHQVLANVRHSPPKKKMDSPKSPNLPSGQVAGGFQEGGVAWGGTICIHIYMSAVPTPHKSIQALAPPAPHFCPTHLCGTPCSASARRSCLAPPSAAEWLGGTFGACSLLGAASSPPSIATSCRRGPGLRRDLLGTWPFAQQRYCGNCVMPSSNVLHEFFLEHFPTPF